MIKKSINNESKNNYITTTEAFDGESIESKVARITESSAPIEAISPMIYTERKDGVRPEYDIRRDKWDIAQTAMQSITDGYRQKSKEKEPATKQEPTNSGDAAK